MSWEEKARMLAKDHVGWFLDTIEPLLEEFFVHGYKHGVKEKKLKPIIINPDDSTNDTYISNR